MTKKKNNKNKKSGQKTTEPELKAPTTNESSQIVCESPFEMVSKVPDSSEQATTTTVEPTVISVVISEESEKLECKPSETPLVIEENVVVPVESAVADDSIEKQSESVVLVEEKPNVEPVEEEEKDEQDEEKMSDVVKVQEEQEKESTLDEEKSESGEEYSDEEEIDGVEESDEEEGDKPTVEEDGRVRKNTSQTEDTTPTESVADSEPEFFTDFILEKKNEELNIKQSILAYNKKFAVFLRVINPEIRYSAECVPCKTFDSDGVQKIFEKMKEQGFDKPCPFDENFEPAPEEIRNFLSEVITQTKFCLRLACAERGYEYKCGKLANQPLSRAWGNDLDPLTELKTIRAIIGEVKESISKLVSDGQEARFWAELWCIFNEVIPALEDSDSKTLAENNISDCLATIHGRSELGFEITEDEVDKMLEQSFFEDGFGEFPPTALYVPSVFTTSKQLKLIYVQLEKMSKVTDIRVKLAGIQTVTRVLELLDDEEAMLLLEEFKDHPKVPVEKMFGFNPLKFEISGHDPKRLQYLKIFYTTLGENNPNEDSEFTPQQLSTVLKCFYLVFPASEINWIFFQILGTSAVTGSPLDTDQKQLIQGLFSLHPTLKKRLEIGAGYKTGEISEDQDSMYYLGKQFIRNGLKEYLPLLASFLLCKSDEEEHLIHPEKVMRMAMKCIETSTAQANAADILRLLKCHCGKELEFSNEFFEDLILLALSKYSVPDANTPAKKYDFISTVFDLVKCYKDNHVLDIDNIRISEKWTDMGHPWFSVLYLSHRFPILKSSMQTARYPWSADVWTDDKKDQNDIKNYVLLAKVPTAWPDCTDLSRVSDLIAEHVPVNISRIELYKRMMEYAAEFTISEHWKKNLLQNFKNWVTFLNKPENLKQSSEDKNTEEKKSDKRRKSSKQGVEVKTTGDSKQKTYGEGLEKDSKETQTSPIPKEEERVSSSNVPDEKEESCVVEVVPTVFEDIIDAKKKEEQTSEVVLMDEIKKEQEECQIEEKEKVILSEPEEERLIETPVSQEVKTENLKDESIIHHSGNNDALKPLKELDSHLFYSYYSQEEWDGLHEKIVAEVYRQRKMHGYSNEY